MRPGPDPSVQPLSLSLTAPEGGLHDAFGQAAWDYLQHNPSTSFHRVEEVQGRPSLRYATADLMRPCASIVIIRTLTVPKRLENRGRARVLEVIFPLDTAVAQTHQGCGHLCPDGGHGGLGLSGLAWFGRLRRSSTDLDQRARRLERNHERQRVEDALRESEENTATLSMPPPMPLSPSMSKAWSASSTPPSRCSASPKRSCWANP